MVERATILLRIWGLPLGPEFSVSVIRVDIDINSDYGDITRVRNVCFWLCFEISEHSCVQSVGPYCRTVTVDDSIRQH